MESGQGPRGGTREMGIFLQPALAAAGIAPCPGRNFEKASIPREGVLFKWKYLIKPKLCILSR